MLPTVAASKHGVQLFKGTTMKLKVALKSFQEINSHSSHALPPCLLALN